MYTINIYPLAWLYFLASSIAPIYFFSTFISITEDSIHADYIKIGVYERENANTTELFRLYLANRNGGLNHPEKKLEIIARLPNGMILLFLIKRLLLLRLLLLLLQ